MLRLILLRLLESYFRHRWLYLVPIVLMLGLAAVYITSQKPQYISEGILYVQKGSLLNSLTAIGNDSFPWLTPAQEAANEINDLKKTDAFIRAIIRNTDLEEEMTSNPANIEETLEEVRVSVWVRPEGTNQLLIGAAHEQREIPTQLVNSIVENYVQWQINEDLSESLVAQEFFQDLAEDYNEDLEKARQEIDNYLLEHPEPERGERSQFEQNQIARLDGIVRLAEQRYVKAIENDEVARLAMTQAEGSIKQTYFLIDAPKMPLGPEISMKSLAVDAAIFGVVGVILSAIGIVGDILLDRSLRFQLDVENQLNLPVLASLPDTTESIQAYRKQETTQTLETSRNAFNPVSHLKRILSQNPVAEPQKKQ